MGDGSRHPSRIPVLLSLLHLTLASCAAPKASEGDPTDAAPALHVSRLDTLDGRPARAALRVVVRSGGDTLSLLDEAWLYEFRVTDEAGREVAPEKSWSAHRSVGPRRHLAAGDSIVHLVDLGCMRAAGPLTRGSTADRSDCASSFPLRTGERYTVAVVYRSVAAPPGVVDPDRMELVADPVTLVVR